jgi:2-polyprenyl-3-methyl-5-hydroxy-6-metoxy-1,4-benzoquinol methylase
MEHKIYHHTRLGPAHKAILAHIVPGSRVLEVGCATGYMTKAMAEVLGCQVVAVELDAQQAEQAKAFADELIVGDITRQATRDQIKGFFDAVVYADVLEHLADPWEVLRWSRVVIGGNGMVLASIPNVAYYKVRKQLLLGRFDYTDFGILDNTHLRFFTEKTARRLFESTGYHVADLARIFRGRTDRLLSWLYPNAFTYQFVIRAKLA